MTGRKTTLEERLKIIEELIKHDVNYNWAAEEYQVMVGIRSIVKAVMPPNHFVIARVKQNLTKIGQKLIVSRRKIVF